MGQVADNLTEMIRDAVEPLGYELVGVEYLSRGKGGSLLRVYIDHPNGILVEDCASVSHQISGVLDVEDPIAENYSLEVSSPGLDRPLFFKKDFERFSGQKVSVKLRGKLQGRRNFEGILDGVDGDDLLVTLDGDQYRLPMNQIDKARLIPEF